MRKEIFGILLFFLVVLTLVSLLSYSPADPSLTHLVSASGRDIHNVFGLVGAYLSGSLVGLFGLGAFWIPPLMLLAAFWQIRNRSRKIMGLTVLGGLFLIISTGGLLSLFRSEYFFWNHPFSSGGIIGSPFSAFLAAYANRSGAILVLSLFFILLCCDPGQGSEADTLPGGGGDGPDGIRCLVMDSVAVQEVEQFP